MGLEAIVQMICHDACLAGKESTWEMQQRSLAEEKHIHTCRLLTE